ncbi:MAG: amidohydrolase family protein [Pseudomonadota bacterium]|nr:amidohydrolase family protein [Pseudomonadota bacterium]
MPEKNLSILIKGGRVYDHDGNTDQPPVSDILVSDKLIAEVGSDLQHKIASNTTVIDATEKLVIPGFVNAHYHSHDVLMKGCFETIPLEHWLLNALPPSYPMRSVAEVRARTLLGAIECLRSGMTSIQDMLTLSPFNPEHVETVISAYAEVGIRCVLSLQIADIPGIERVPFWKEVVPERFHKDLGASAEPTRDDPLLRVKEQFNKHRNASPRISWGLGPTSPEFCTPKLLEDIRDFAAEYSLPVITHIYESRGMALAGRLYMPEHDGSQVKYLESTGLLGPNVGLAHSVWMRDDEIGILAETGTNVILNPVGNLKTRSGVPPIRSFLDAGVQTAIGCDNCSCGDAQNMFHSMKAFAGLAAVTDPEPGPPTAADTLYHATRGGAHALGLGDQTGALLPGMKADIAIIDLSTPQFMPLNSVARQTVFAESGEGVETVIIDGEIVLKDRKVTGIDEGALYEEVDAVMPKLREDMQVVFARNAAMQEHLLHAWRRTWKTDIGLNRYVGNRVF